MSLKKSCENCGKKISLRKMPNGHWIPFDYYTKTVHDCPVNKPLKINISKPKTNSESTFARSKSSWGYSNSNVNETLSLINLALKEGKLLRIVYYTGSRNAWSTRDILPMKVYQEHGTFYIRAYCMLRNEERIFRLDRIKSAELITRSVPPNVNEILSQPSIISQSENNKSEYDQTGQVKAPPKPNESACYIATAIYGSYDCPQVWTLRRFRDNILAKTRKGRIFIKCYYIISPTIIKRFGRTEWFNRFWKGKLDKIIFELHVRGIEATPYEDRNK
jgi:hypothetical protein